MRCRTTHATVGLVVLFLFFVCPSHVRAGDTPEITPTGRHVLVQAVNTWLKIIEPPDGAVPRTLSASLKVVTSEGLPWQVSGASGTIAYQAPDRLRIAATVEGHEYSAGRFGDQIWVDEPVKHFAVLGKPGVVRFHADPASVDHSTVPPFAIPISRAKISVALLALSVKMLPEKKMGDDACYVLHITPRAAAAELLHFKAGEVELWIRQSDFLPLRVIYTDPDSRKVQVDATDMKLISPAPDDSWQLHPAKDDHVETVAVSHLLRFLEARKLAMDKCPPLPPAEGKRQLIATEGEGRLELVDGARVLFLKGSPAEMGHQHGVLLNREIHAVAERILYGVGVGSSFARGAWFLSEIENAESRLKPFMDKRYTDEEDAIAQACGMDVQEARLANFFPELFHCSGFAIFGKATKDGHIYHGRVLDYLKGVGLEQNAVTIVHQPSYGHAWVNVSYAGFVGSVTAMNDQGISIGEMGGNGYGNWDGKPMAHLVREVMEKASTLDEAIRIMRDSPRTCQYYYVIADGKTHDAVGISANPKEFITVKPGESHPLLPKPQPDTVLLSAGARYDTLAGRVKENFGQFDSDSARRLMDPPVCMKSNIQSVLFEPDTLDFWVANADAQHVASLTRYTHYNLHELLKEEWTKGQPRE